MVNRSVAYDKEKLLYVNFMSKLGVVFIYGTNVSQIWSKIWLIEPSRTSASCDNLSLIISHFYALIEMLNCPDADFMITVRLKSSEGRWFNVKNIIPHRQSYVAHARSNANVNSLCHHWPRVTLASDWSTRVTWPEYWPLIGQFLPHPTHRLGMRESSYPPFLMLILNQ